MSTILAELPPPNDNESGNETQSTISTSLKSEGSKTKSSKLKKKKKDKKKRKGEDKGDGDVSSKKKAKTFLDDSDDEGGGEDAAPNVTNVTTVSVGGDSTDVVKMTEAPPTPEVPPPPAAAPKKEAKGKAAPPVKEAKPEAAPPKKKKKVNTGELIVEAIRRECGPMNNTMIAERTRANKAVVDKLVQKFVEKHIIKKKKVGKEGTKAIYYANQNHKDNKVEKVNVADIDALQAEFEKTSAELNTINVEIQSLKSQKKNSELDDEIKAIQDVVIGLQGRVDLCKKNASPSCAAKKKFLLGGKPRKELPSDSKSLKSRINNMRTEWVKRKAKCAEFIEMAADGMDKKPKDVMKIMGVDSDESEGVKMPEKYVL